MARARSPDSIKAEEMYQGGMRLVDIAKELNVPEGTVRRWKSTQRWDDRNANNKSKKKTERSPKKKANVRKKGAPVGNRNAVGHKGVNTFSSGNKAAEKHGAYSAVYWDVLDDIEKNMIEDITMDEEMLLIEQIQLFAVRERRIMIAINKYRNQEGAAVLLGATKLESKRAFNSSEDEELYNQKVREKVAKGDRLPGESYSQQTQTENKDNMIARLEKELSTIQSKKTKAIEALAKLRLEKRKIAEDDSANDAVMLWAEKIKNKRKDIADG